MIFNRIHITYDGYLNACCIDFDNNLAVADLLEMTLNEAWNCENIVNLRKQHLNNKLEKTACYNCKNNTEIEILPIDKKFIGGR